MYLELNCSFANETAIEYWSVSWFICVNIVRYSCFNLRSSRLLRQSSTDWCSGKVVIVARRMIPLLRGQRQAHSLSAGTAESHMPSRLSWGIGRAATLLKTLLQYFGKSLEALPGVAYPSFWDNRSTLNTKTGYKKKCVLCMCSVAFGFWDTVQLHCSAMHYKRSALYWSKAFSMPHVM